MFYSSFQESTAVLHTKVCLDSVYPNNIAQFYTLTETQIHLIYTRIIKCSKKVLRSLFIRV